MTFKQNETLGLLPQSPEEVMQELAHRARALRLEANLTQVGLASRSGVSLGSIKRFERTGEIALKSLLNIALVLQRLTDFDAVLTPSDRPVSLFAAPPRLPRQRGRRS